MACLECKNSIEEFEIKINHLVKRWDKIEPCIETMVAKLEKLGRDVDNLQEVVDVWRINVYKSLAGKDY